MKVVVTGLFGDGFEDSLTTEFPSVDFVFAASEEDQIREIKDADASFRNRSPAGPSRGTRT